jgi:hypothetical protein
MPAGGSPVSRSAVRVGWRYRPPGGLCKRTQAPQDRKGLSPRRLRHLPRLTAWNHRYAGVNEAPRRSQRQATAGPGAVASGTEIANPNSPSAGADGRPEALPASARPPDQPSAHRKPTHASFVQARFGARTRPSATAGGSLPELAARLASQLPTPARPWCAAGGPPKAKPPAPTDSRFKASGQTCRRWRIRSRLSRTAKGWWAMGLILLII